MLHGKLEVTTLGSELRVRTNALFKAFFLDLLLFFLFVFFHFGWEIKKRLQIRYLLCTAPTAITLSHCFNVKIF